MKAELQATVTRGAESWQFFAFVFAAFGALGLSLIDDLGINPTCRIVVKIAYFLLCFYIFIVNVWVRNKLAGFLGWTKREEHGRVT
jgi:hypothetical protein